MSNATILLIEDSTTLSTVYQEYLADMGEEILPVETGQEALDFLAESTPKVVLLDLNLPDMEGMDILKHVHERELPCAVVIITAHGSVDIAVDAMRYGSFDFLSKPFDAKRLQVTVRNALKHYDLNHLVTEYREQYEKDSYHDFIGSSMPMQTVYRIIESAAPSKATVFITGESGTGKELCAEAVHKQSDRKDKPFIPLNCAAIPKDLMESEIFGHAKGAFTGAVKERDGAASLADGGTLFLDELCEMDLDLQSKILRFIQTGTFQKVGSGKSETVDVRFVCATNRDPLTEVREGRFREDLYYRLHVIPIQLPPLRERGSDIIQIAEKFLRTYAKEEKKYFIKFGKQAEDIMMNYEWPGNVRQLQNVIRNLVVLNSGEVVMPNQLPPPLGDVTPDSIPSAPPVMAESAQTAVESAPTSSVSAPVETATDSGEIIPLWLAEKKIIERAIDICDGNIPQAANLLEVSPSTLYRKKQTWEEME